MEKDEQCKKDITGIEHGMFYIGDKYPKKSFQHFTTFFLSTFLMWDWKKFNYHNGLLGLDWQCYLSAQKAIVGIQFLA